MLKHSAMTRAWTLMPACRVGTSPLSRQFLAEGALTSSHFVEELCKRDVKCLRYLGKPGYADVVETALNIADGRPVNIRLECQLLLTETPCLA